LLWFLRAPRLENIIEGEEKYHKQWARTAASKTLVTVADGEEVGVGQSKKER
jgi:hypothetical protein